AAIALDAETLDAEALEQVTSVSQLSDVRPTDWAYTALQSLVERYGCIAGYPDGSFRGRTAMSRYEFAAGLNACLQQISEQIEQTRLNQQDVATLQRLQSEFETELADLREQVDSLEVRTAELEANQFSTTTRLRGTVSISTNGLFGGERADGSGDDIDENVTLNYRARLNFDTSFTGRDLLKVRLDALEPGRFGAATAGTNMTRLSFDRDTDGDFTIGKFFYRFPATEDLRFTIDAVRGAFQTNVPSYNPTFFNPVSGAVSRFGRFNPIYYQGITGAGVTANYELNDVVAFSGGYLARNGEDPSDGSGLFNGSYAALAQLEISPTDDLGFGLTYARAYYPGGEAFVSGGTGSRLANAPFGQIATSSHQFGAQTSWRLADQFLLSGWAGLTLANAQVDSATVEDGDDATILNWAISLAALDLVQEGDALGFLVGQPPRVLDNDSGPEDDDVAWHLESFYRYRLTDNIQLIPGVLVVFNPEHDSDNDTLFGVNLRTVFQF
ncbi:MAG: iron uptake porin, partial [Cyanobacteria bacterium P01_A01_bin.135]